jgi:hypothetical protein
MAIVEELALPPGHCEINSGSTGVIRRLGSHRLQGIDAGPKGDGFRTIPKSASSEFSTPALQDGKQPARVRMSLI